MSLRVRKNRSPDPDAVCPIQICMKLLGGTWAPTVVWYLRGGPRRFGELRTDIPPISAKVLSACLKRMEAQGLVRRAPMPTSPPSVEYALTTLGQDLIPALEVILSVGKRLKESQRRT